MIDDTTQCDCCKREAPLHLLYPFFLSGKPHGRGFRCNVCVDTENRLIAKYGLMRDQINNELSSGPYRTTDLTMGMKRNYLHIRTFPNETDSILPPANMDYLIENSEAMESVLAMQTRFMKTGKITDEELTNLMALLGIFIEIIDEDAKQERFYKTAMKRLLYTTFSKNKEESHE